MKKLYLFIFLIVIGGVMQIQPVNARTNKLLYGKKAKALNSQTITFAPIATQTFGGADVTLTATSTSALAVTLTSNNTSVVTIVAGKLHIIGVGTTTITATQPGDGLTYAAATPVNQSVTVNKGGTAVISAFPNATLILASTDVAFPAVSTFAPATYPNNPIIYTSSNPNVATIVNGRLHMVATGTGAGAVVITASQPGNGNFTDAAQVMATYTINPPPAVVFTTSLAGKVVGSADVDPAATVGAYFSTITYTSSNTNVVTIVNNKLHFLAPCTAGSVTITAVLTYPVGTGGTATVTTPNTTLAITNPTATTTLPPAITLITPASRAFGDVDFPIVTTTTYTLPVPITYTSSNTTIVTVVNGNIHMVAPGTGVTITASQGGGTGSATTPADITSVPFNITAPTLGMAVIAKVSNAVDFSPPVVATLTNTPVVYAVVPIAGQPIVAVIANGVVHLTGLVGTANIKASQQGNTTTTASPATATLPADVTALLTVTAAAAPTITFAALGTKQYSPVEVAAGATSNLATPAITYTSSNSSVAFITANSIVTTAPTAFGLGYTPGIYNNVPLTAGSGTGAQATIIVSSSGQAIATVTNPGKGYNLGDILSISPLSLNNTTNGSGFALTVTAVSSNNIHFMSAPAAPNNSTVITASQGGGPNGTVTLPADVQQVLIVTQPSISLPTIGSKSYTAQDLNTNVSSNMGATATVPYKYIYQISNNPAVATITATQAFTLTSGGTLYTNGTYTNVPLIGGTGTGMLATLVVASGSVTLTTTNGVTTGITNVGFGYTNLDVLTVPSSSIGGTGSGLIITLGTSTAGYTSFVHYNSTVPASPNNTALITASMNGGINGTTTLAPDVTQTLTLIAPAINFPPLGTKQFTSTDINPGASGALMGLPVTYTSSNPLVATIVNGYIHFIGAPAAPNNTTLITASQAALPGVNIGTQTLPANVSQTLTVTPPTITFPALGSKTLGADFNPGATSTITNTPIIYTSSNPAVATINATGISTITSITGTLYSKPGIFLNVPLIGGTGTGATATVFVSTFAGSTFGIIANSGTGYTVGDVLTITQASVSSTAGAGFSITVTGVASMVHYIGAPASPNNTTLITASQSGGATGTLTLPADVAQTLTVNAPVITFPALGTKQLTSTDFNPGASSTLSGTPITYTSSNTAIATVLTGTIAGTAIITGINYADGTYITSLTGGTGTGATATVTYLTGSATTVTLSGNTSGYSVSDVLTPVTGGLGTTGSGFTLSVTSVGSAIHFVSAPASPNNTVTITASQGGGATGSLTLPSDATQILTVTPPSINFSALNSKAYPQVDILLNATSTLNKPIITYTSSNTAVVTINVATANGVTSSYLHLVSAPASPNNTSIITASQGGGASGTTTLPADALQTVTVTQIVPTFTFPPLGTRILTSVDVPPGVISPLAGIPITYSSDNTAVATIVNNKVHMVAAGTANIIVSQGGGVSGTLTIPADAKQAITITAPIFTFPPLGTKPYSPIDFNPGATSSILNIPVTYTSSNTNVATVYTTLLLGTPIGGSGYVNGTYLNVALTGGTGSGAKATVVVQAGAVVSVTPTAIGTLYTPGDILSCQALSIGGTGNGFNVNVASYYSLVHLNPTVPAAPNNTTTITASLGGGAAGTSSLPADLTQLLTVVTPTITFPAPGTVTYTPVDFNPGATTSITSPTITYTSSNTNVATIKNSLSLGALTSGSGYVNGTYTNVALTGGVGAGAQATIVVTGGTVSSVTITAPGKVYAAADVLSCTTASIGGGAGSGFKVLVANFSSMVHLVLPVQSPNTTNITASVSGGAVVAYPLPADVTQTLTVSAPTYVFTALGSKPFTSTDIDLLALPTPIASSTVPGLITFTSSDTTLAKIVANKLHLVKTFTGGVGAIITATQNSLVIATSTLTGVTSPTMVFPTLGASIAFKTPDIIPAAISPNNTVAITYTSSDATVINITNNALHLNKLGTVTIRATQQNTPAASANAAASGALPADQSQSLTITAPTLALTTTLGSKAFTITDLPLASTASITTIPVTYTSSDPNVAVILNGNVHYVGIGSTTITASQSAAAIAAGLPAPPDASATLTVTAPTLTFASLGITKPWNSTDLPITQAAATLSSTMGTLSPIVLTSSDPSVATIVYTNGIASVHYVGIGTCTITASQAGVGNLPAPASISQAFTVTPATIAIAAPGAKTTASIDAVPTITVTLAITAAPLTYATSDPTVATFNAGALHIVGVGTCTITASQITIANYAPIPATQVVTVSVLTTPLLSFTTPLGTKQYTNGADIIPTVTATATAPIVFTSSNPLVATIVNNNIHLTPPAVINGVAIYPTPAITIITVSQGGGPNGTATLPADASQVLTVTPASITFLPLGIQKMTTADLNPGATSTYTQLAADNSALPIIYTSSDQTVATITSSAISSTTVSTTGSGYTPGNYTNIPLTGGTGSGAQASIIVSTAGQAIAIISNSGKGYTTGDVLSFAPASLISTSGGSGFSITVGSVSSSLIHFVAPGNTVITASQGNVIVPDVSQTLTVISAPALSFPTATASKVFTTADAPGGAISTVTTTPIYYSSSDPTVISIVTNPINTVSASIAGIGYTPGSYSNIPLTGGTGTGALASVVVTPAGLATATITNGGKGYATGDVLSFVPASLGTTPTSGGSGFSLTIGSIGNGLLHFNGTGVVTITATQTIPGTPITNVSASQIVTVTAPVLTFVTARTATFTLADQDPGATSPVTILPITYTSSNPALVSIVNNKLHFNILTPTNGGYDNVAIITATQASAGNYPALIAAQTLTLNQSIIVQNPLTKYYGDPDFSPAVSSFGYPVAYTSATAAVAIPSNGGLTVHIIAPGTSILTASQAGDASTIAAASTPCILTVAPAPLIISPKSITRLYGVENPVQYPLIYTGFKSASGNAPLDDSTKFTAQPTLTNLTSAAAPTVNILLANGGFIPKTLPVGVYTLTYSGAASTLYTILYGTGTLTITAATQTLTMDQTPITKRYKDPDFDPLARSTGDPVVYTSSDPTIATISNGKVHITGVGLLTITASITTVASGNYQPNPASLSLQLTILPGNQTIVPKVIKANQTIAAAFAIPFLVKGAGKYTVRDSATSGLPIQLSIADPSIASVSDSTIKPLHIGTTLVTIKQPGNNLYAAAPDVVLFLKVIDVTGDAVEVHQALSPNGDGINDFLLIEGVQDYPGNHVSIINRNGIKVFSTSSYDNKTNVFVGKSNSGDQLPAGTYYYLVDYNVGDTKNHITGYFVLKY